MSGADWLAVLILAGIVILSCCVDWWRTRRHQALQDLDDLQGHLRLMDEVRRQP